ncbi:hypothetical protein IMG5_128870 [Ichthyophthirius multifiliis]|uniref:Sas10 C-terminal domain-containing protein n=1 Tax=Ichthyophthirius multifiliis TaxID=5932 RepID=G0QW20_ICHMU|nr:hypothetical protein IMG5_128870 [Ichthyophthirius multifiliis]EGR30584.1 hypothetical protein IMG5_128870 [Ichthyophthirius multifiliis]|eukprot:XP_004032171.1 hypothetical protein IMG5_128870 [Ichthyophthirius multifiliis]
MAKKQIKNNKKQNTKKYLEEDEKIENSEQEASFQQEYSQEYESNSDLVDSIHQSEQESQEDELKQYRGVQGTKKDDYYKESDITDSQDSGEEAEAEEQYNENQKMLDERDFIDDDFANKEDLIQEEEENEEEFNQEMNEKLKEKIIKKSESEIISLANEININTEELIQKLIPLLDIEKAKKIMIGKGKNFLEIKFELLSCYVLCLTRKRKKIDSNSRVKLRRKFTKQMVKHNRMGAKVYQKQINYDGELGVIKSSLIKSVKLS